MRIGELAQETNCGVQTIRYYEREGLLPQPERTASGYRRYHSGHVEQLNFVRHCRSLDLPLVEIKRLLICWRNPGTTCTEVNQLLDNQIDQVDRRIAELKQLRSQLQVLRQSCRAPRAVSDCGILRSLAVAEGEGCVCHRTAAHAP